MKATGIVRRIDDLGRIVVPKEIRRTLRIREGDALEIFTDREGEIILKKYSPLGEMGNFADQYAESLAQTLGYLVCITDTDQVIAAAGPGKKEFQEQLITRQLAEVIARREQFLASSMDRKFTVIVSGQNAELKWQVVSPIICAGDAIGSVVILAKDGRKKPGELEHTLRSRISGTTDGTVKEYFIRISHSIKGQEGFLWKKSCLEISVLQDL